MRVSNHRREWIPAVGGNGAVLTSMREYSSLTWSQHVSIHAKLSMAAVSHSVSDLTVYAAALLGTYPLCSALPDCYS